MERIRTFLLSILVTLLLGCSTLKPPSNYGNGDPGFIKDGELYWVGNPSEEERLEWWVTHMEPSLDEREEVALKRLRLSIYGDLGSTAIGLFFCSTVAEGNPVGAALVPLNIAAYQLIKRDLEKSSRYTSTVTPTYIITGSRGLIFIHNLSILGRCL